MTEEELDQHISRMMDSERVRDAILKLEIESLKKAVDGVENVSGIRKSHSREQEG